VKELVTEKLHAKQAKETNKSKYIGTFLLRMTVIADCVEKL